MGLHPALLADVNARRSLPKIFEVGAPAMRARVEAFTAAMSVSRPAINEVRDELVPDKRIPVRWYRNSTNANQPLIIFLHGGGFVHSSISTHDWLCRHLCQQTGAVIVSVDYRLAPEHPFPAGLDDCVAATQWARERFGVPGKLADYAMIGDSAGGNLCAAVALRMRSEGQRAALGQAMFYPCFGGHLLGYRSYQANQEYGFDLKTYDWLWEQYIGPNGPAKSPFAFPLLERDFSALPPTLIIPAKFDIMFDDGEAYIQRLKAAGGSGECRPADNMNHGFLFRADFIDEPFLAIESVSKWIVGRFE